jgi:hypothetical protein
VGEGFDAAVALLREVGYTHLMRYEKRRAIPVPLT